MCPQLVLAQRHRCIHYGAIYECIFKLIVGTGILESTTDGFIMEVQKLGINLVLPFIKRKF
jgi:hypothetical protein